MYVVNQFLLSNVYLEMTKHNFINIHNNALPFKSIESFDLDLRKRVLLEQKKNL